MLFDIFNIKTGIWCDIYSERSNGFYDFENNEGVGDTVTAEKYQDIIRILLVSEMQEKELEDI